MGHEHDGCRTERGCRQTRHVSIDPTARETERQAGIMCAMAEGQKSKPMDVFVEMYAEQIPIL
jgi:hypothetical protein